jgi:nucleoside-triphosphatase
MKDGGNRRLILITGRPGTGKTTALLKTAEKLHARGYKVGGMISREIRENGIRVGFEILDYASRRRGWLAHTRQPVGPQIGRYRVNIDSLNSVGATAILKAIENTDVVLIDEIGPMELCSKTFVEAVRKAVDGPKPTLATIHYRAQSPFIKQTKARKDADLIEVTPDNRSKLPDIIAGEIISYSKEKIS